MRSLTLLFLLGCFSALGQEKITDFVTDEVRNEQLLPVGKMDDYFYTITPDLGISRIHATTRELSSFLPLPQVANRSFDGIIAGNRLYFYDTRIDSSKLTIYKVNVPGASYQEILTVADARAIVKNGDLLYVTCSRGLKRIDLKQEPAKVETLLPESRIEGDTRPYSVFDLRDSTGKHISRAFLDAGHQLHTVSPEVYGTLNGVDYGDFVLFSFRFNPRGYYYFDKKSEEFKPLMISGKGLLANGVLSDVIERQGRYFVIYTYSQNISNEVKGFVSLHELKEGVLYEIFAEQAQLFPNYNEAPPAAGVFAPVFYSNCIEKDGRIYFWAKESHQYNQDFDFRLNVVDIEKKELRSWPVNNTEIFNRMNRQVRRVSFYLSPGPKGVYTHNLNDDRINFEYDEASGSFREVNVYAPRNVHFVSTHLLLNFTYPNRVMAYGIYNTHQQILKLETPVKKTPIDGVNYAHNEILFINNREHEVHFFDGSKLESGKLPFAGDFKQVKFWHLTPASGSSFLLLGVHGVRSDDVEGGHLYAVSKSTFELAKIKTFDTGFNADPFQISQAAGPMSLVCVNGTDYLYTDYSPENTLSTRDAALGEGATLVHSFNGESALLKNAVETFYYNFKTQTKIDLLGATLHDRVYNNRVFYTYQNDLYFISPEGNKTRVAKVGNDFSNLAGETDDFLLFRTSNAVGVLNKHSWKYTEFKISSTTYSKYLAINESYYLFGATEIIKLNMEKGTIESIRTNIKEIVNPSVFENKIFFHEAFAPDYEKSRVWCLEDGKLRVLIEELNIKNNGHQALDRPVVFRNKATQNPAFWIPEKEKMFYFTGHDFSDNEYLHYQGFIAGNHYFYSYSDKFKKWEIFVFNVATEEFKSVLLETPDFHRVYSFGDSYFYASDEAIWRLKGAEQEVFTDLVPVRFISTDLFGFKNNLYVWAKDENQVPQVYRLTDNEYTEEPDVLLPTENPTLNFSFYPNPTADHLTISSPAKGPAKYKVTVFSTEGKILSEKESELPHKLDLSGLKHGIYLINVRSDRESKTFRAVKQ